MSLYDDDMMNMTYLYSCPHVSEKFKSFVQLPTLTTAKYCCWCLPFRSCLFCVFLKRLFFHYNLWYPIISFVNKNQARNLLHRLILVIKTLIKVIFFYCYGFTSFIQKYIITFITPRQNQSLRWPFWLLVRSKLKSAFSLPGIL